LGLAFARLVAAGCLLGVPACFLAGALAESALNATLFTPGFFASLASAAGLPVACFFFFFAADNFFRCIRPITLLKLITSQKVRKENFLRVCFVFSV
jgi:hypothetical protein